MMKTKNKLLFICIFIVIIGVVLFALQKLPYRKAVTSSSAASAVSKVDLSAYLPPPLPLFGTQIAQAKKKNSDTVGWLDVPNTTLNMAIVQTSNNNYYLKQNFSKQYYWKGWPFADYRDKFNPLPKNLIIYGHNMGDGMLFGQLKKYDSLKYLNSNPIIYFSTPTCDYQYKIFAVYITDVNFYYIQTDFKSDADFASYIGQVRKRSLYNTSVYVAPDDDILTLSTCTYEFHNARFVIQARLERPGEYNWVAPAKINPNPASPYN